MMYVGVVKKIRFVLKDYVLIVIIGKKTMKYLKNLYVKRSEYMKWYEICIVIVVSPLLFLYGICKMRVKDE